MGTQIAITHIDMSTHIAITHAPNMNMHGTNMCGTHVDMPWHTINASWHTYEYGTGTSESWHTLL